MKARQSLYLVLLLTILSGCIIGSNNNEFQKQSLLGVLYTQTSTEFVANNIQTFASATSQLEQAINNKEWVAAVEQKDNYGDKPPAIF